MNINIAQVPVMYQAALTKADTGGDAKNNNGVIDTKKEMLAAAREVSEASYWKYIGGEDSRKAEIYLRRVVLGEMRGGSVGVMHIVVPENASDEERRELSEAWTEAIMQDIEHGFSIHGDGRRLPFWRRRIPCCPIHLVFFEMASNRRQSLRAVRTNSRGPVSPIHSESVRERLR
jgi:hypothetical protein